MGRSVGEIAAGSVGNRQCMVQENSSMSVDKQTDECIGKKWVEVEEGYLIVELDGLREVLHTVFHDCHVEELDKYL